jgi:ATP-dependent protease HslVU (ClpYQ) peptidase subunit
MTCIIALEHLGRVFMAGDSAAADDNWNLQQMDGQKVFKIGKFLFGYTSSFRMGQLLQFNLEIPEQGDEGEMCFLVTKLIPAIRKCLKDGGYTEIKDNRENAGSFLVGYQGKVYKVCSDFQILRTRGGITSVGCGGEYALGALEALKSELDDHIEHTELILLRSLEIVQRFSAGVSQPFYVEVL